MTNCHEKLRQYRKWGLERAVISDIEMDALVSEFDALRAQVNLSFPTKTVERSFGVSSPLPAGLPDPTNS